MTTVNCYDYVAEKLNNATIHYGYAVEDLLDEFADIIEKIIKEDDGVTI